MGTPEGRGALTLHPMVFLLYGRIAPFPLGQKAKVQGVYLGYTG